MNDNPQVNGTRGGSGPSFVMTFALGALVGAGIALLLAASSGKETRQRLADTGRRWGDAARSKIDQARDCAKELKRDAKAALEAGFEAFEHDRRSHEPRAALETELKR